ncbi:MAG: ribonuclease H, partial [bacterium]
MITIFTDGSSRGNPGPGGWGYLLRTPIVGGFTEKEASGAEISTTNNRMELRAVIEGLSSLSDPSSVLLYSDSQYVVNADEKGWLKNWIKTDFKGGKKNKD